MKTLIISGLSGAGKSKAASYLEDMGYYIVDNMPAAMILKFAEFAKGSRYEQVALVYDVRTALSFTELFGVLDQLEAMGCACKLLFLEASAETIIKRYKETRRRHPLAEKTDTLEEAVLRERELLSPVRARADVVIDTSRLSTAQLQQEMLRLFGADGGQEGMGVTVTSFGFKHGLPLDADLVFDVRCLPNPFYIEELRSKTGLDAPVRDYVFSFRESHGLLEQIQNFLTYALPLYAEEGKTGLVVAVGCTGGHHRSVAFVHALAEFCREKGYPTREIHRDISH
ncbi:MAG: RNase adapter RapZ [Oscillibacter sp.]|nr:RNase adapter RapZ [Oscillibacter sp.]MBQ2997080.1 RNase adapter RapZ [Oscillibacter sp.]